MIYIFTALFPEARPLIGRLGLKRSPDQQHFSAWISEDHEYLLAVTGPGPISAAIVSSSVFTIRPPAKDDYIVNIGICAGIGMDQTGQCFLCSSVTDTDSGRSYYPDLLWKHSFPEAALCSGSRVLTDSGDPFLASRCRKGTPLLYDMEAAALYQSSAVYAGPHQMSFLKIVSDKGDGSFPSPEEVTGLTAKWLPQICRYMEELPGPGQQPPDSPLLESLSADLHCSVTMQHTLRQYLIWASLTASSLEEKIQEMYTSGVLPCKDRKEGKKILEQLRSFLL